MSRALEVERKFLVEMISKALANYDEIITQELVHNIYQNDPEAIGTLAAQADILRHDIRVLEGYLRRALKNG